MIIEAAEVAALRIDGEIVCDGCASVEEAQEAREDTENLVLQSEIERTDDLWYCDRCGRRITG